jgi:phage host-nuclease inhibitor protein Gam
MIMAVKGTRHKRTAEPALKSVQDAERCVGEIAKLTIERDQALNEMDAKIQSIRVNYEDLLAGLTADLEAEMAMAQQWAESNPKEFSARKSIEMTHGTIGFRTGMPRLKTLKGMTWEKVVNRLRAATPEFIRRKEEADKDRLLAERATLDLPSIGLQVVQDETFFVEVKREVAAEV